ncbi:ABC transporter permease [Brevibacterium otitidis]|uniref:ABC transporter permease n=1 Tax=Brevibacterium otitidis TaxID=53364 RepID=A0ABV5X0A8_9MICO|nr:ABC transporter permease [Brevibacterium otitidis]
MLRRTDRLLLAEAFKTVASTPFRSVLSSLGLLISVTAVISVLSLTTTVRFQVAADFDVRKATEIIAQINAIDPDAPHAVDSDAGRLPLSGVAFPTEAVERVRQLSGVEEVGSFSDSYGQQLLVSTSNLPDSAAATAPPVMIAGPGLFEAAEATIRGRPYDAGLAHADIAYLGKAAAETLGMSSAAHSGEPRYIFVSGHPFLVAGIIEESPRLPQLGGAVIVPTQTAIDRFGPPGDGESLLVTVAPGAAGNVARALPTAVFPAQPDALRVTPPTESEANRRSVDSLLVNLGIGVAVLASVIGAASIAITGTIGVSSRTGELGLRRAIGGRPRDLLEQILFECAFIGVLAGVLGTVVGTACVLIVCAVQNWVPVVSPTHLIAVPLAAIGVSVLAGLIPAWRAGRIQPAAALRQ